MVAEEGTWCGVEVDIAVQATHVPHVLTFEVRAVGPADNLYADVVAALADVGCDVEFGIVVTALGVAHLLAVNPYEGSGVETVEMEEDALAVPAFGEVEGAAVGAYGIVAHTADLVADEGRVVGKGIVDVDIHRFVVAEHFPASGDMDVVPCRRIYVVAVEFLSGAFVSVVGKEELPLSAEREVGSVLLGCQPGKPVGFGVALEVGGSGIGDEGGVCGFLVDAEYTLVLPNVVAGGCRWWSDLRGVDGHEFPLARGGIGIVGHDDGGSAESDAPATGIVAVVLRTFVVVDNPCVRKHCSKKAYT